MSTACQPLTNGMRGSGGENVEKRGDPKKRPGASRVHTGFRRRSARKNAQRLTTPDSRKWMATRTIGPVPKNSGDPIRRKNGSARNVRFDQLREQQQRLAAARRCRSGGIVFVDLDGFKLVNDESINAFALPGGPMYVHTGLIKAASNEGEVAGVLAHEMSHVALRHGAAQMGKQQTWGTLFGALGAIGGAVLSQGGQCTLLCQAAQMGAGIGGGATLNRFSRGYERDADLNGARMMAAAGYNPIELARFFDKLLEQQGAAAQTSGLEKFLSDHPATGNRIEYVQARAGGGASIEHSYSITGRGS